MVSLPIEVSQSPSRCVGVGKVEIAHAPAQLTAMLGSCVAVAIYDQQNATGTLAHIVMPQEDCTEHGQEDFAVGAVTEAIEILKEAGCNETSLVAKLTGGAEMFGTDERLEVDRSHVDTIRQAVEASKVKLLAEHSGGTKGRHVTFDSQTGMLQIESPGEETISL